jgi:8-oxo-dGTP pyrophosphatase MutT (NUDIX family)
VMTPGKPHANPHRAEMSPKPWTVLSTTKVLDARYLRVHREEVTTGSGVLLNDFHVIESPSWAAVICLTTANELVLVRQYRHGRGGTSLELPAGIIEPGEPPQEAAARELLEETGYRASEITPLWEICPEPARHRQRAHFFFARASDEVETLALEVGEDVEVELRSVQELDDIVREMVHGLHVGALLLAARKGILPA